MTTKKTNPWVPLKKTSTASSSRSETAPNSKPGSLAALQMKTQPDHSPAPPSDATSESPQTPSTSPRPSRSLAKLRSATGSKSTISPKPSTKVTLGRILKPTTGANSVVAVDSSSASMTSTSTPTSTDSPTSSSTDPSPQPSTATKSNSLPRAMTTRQPFGGASLHESARSAHIRRAKRLLGSFPPGTKVSIEWDQDRAYSKSPGSFVGVIFSYDERGWLTAYSADNVKLWIPCAMVRIRKAT